MRFLTVCCAALFSLAVPAQAQLYNLYYLGNHTVSGITPDGYMAVGTTLPPALPKLAAALPGVGALLPALPQLAPALPDVGALLPALPQLAPALPDVGALLPALPELATAFVPGVGALPLGALPGGRTSRANGGNARHRIVGHAAAGPLGLNTHAFLWSNEQGMVDLAAHADTNLSSAAMAIAPDDTVVGYADSPASPGSAAVPTYWARGSSWELPTLGGEGGWVSAVNAGLNMAGAAQIPDGAFHATFWGVDGRVADLHPRGHDGFSAVYALNNANWCAGMYDGPDGRHAFIAQPCGVPMAFLPPLPGHVGSSASGLNNAGAVVGASFPPVAPELLPPPPDHAVLWAGGGVVDLNARLATPIPGVHLSRAVGIAENGRIAVQGLVNGKTAAFMLVPR